MASHDKSNGTTVADEVEVPEKNFKAEVGEALDPWKRLIITKEDPFDDYRDKGLGRQIVTFLFYAFPILEWLSQYKIFQWLLGDVIAGLTITSLAVPQDLAYALLAKVPPVNGLYSSFLPPLVYSILGTSRHIAIGPTAVISLLMGSLMSQQVDPGDETTYLHFAFTVTFWSGIIQLALGVLRLGWVIEYLSHATTVGFMAGAAITIGLAQMRGFLGYTSRSESTDIIANLKYIFTNTSELNWRSLTIGMCFLVFLLTLKTLAWWYKGHKRAGRILFFMNCLGPFTSVFIATLFIFITGTSNQCCYSNSYNCSYWSNEKNAIVKCGGKPGPVPCVTPIPKGVSNLSSVQTLIFSGPLLVPAIGCGIVVGLISLTEAVAIGRTFAAKGGYHINGDKEMMAYGLMNIAGAFTSSIATTGSFSRSSVNFQAGGHTMLTNILMSIVILLTLVAITDVFLFLPSAVLSAVIISAVIGLFDLGNMWHLWKSDKFDFLIMLGTFLGVIFNSIEIGLLVGVILSMLRMLVLVTRPHILVLGEVDGSFQNVKQYQDAKTADGILVLRFDAPLYFASAQYLREKLLDLAGRYHLDHDAPLEHIVIDVSASSDIDTTAIIAFEEAMDALHKMDPGIELALANPSTMIMRKLNQSGFLDKIGHHNIFRSVGEALSALQLGRHYADGKRHQNGNESGEDV